MPKIAFYAPMKPPAHPTPSGDRAMARNLIAALSLRGDTVTVASDLRIYDGSGDTDAQDSLSAAAQAEIRRLTDRQGGDSRPDVWVTYHNYYKAPDLIGPAVAAALSIPYVQIESTRAKKRLAGPWSRFAAASEAAADRADLIFYLTEQDRVALARDAPATQQLCRLKPFLPVTALPEAATLPDDGPILAVGMMRPGDKLASYRIIAETLAHLTHPGWRLEIAGDGPAKTYVENILRPFADRVRFLGRLDATEMAAAYARASAFFWPGVNEAFGMVYLEAQAAGLPNVAQARPGLADVLAPARYPEPQAGPEPLAHRLDALLATPTLRQHAGQAARAHVRSHHLISQAADTLLGQIGRITTPKGAR